MHSIVRLITGAIIPGIIVGVLMVLAWLASPVEAHLANQSQQVAVVSYEACRIGPDPRNCTWDGIDNGTVGTLNYWISPNEKVWALPHHVAHFIIGWEYPPRTEYMPCSNADEAGDEQGPRNCVHDARHSGNGMGNSFFVGNGGRIWPLPHHIAHYLLGLDRQPA